jgi:hypothetical protein
LETTATLLSGLPSVLSMMKTVNWLNGHSHAVERLPQWLVYDEYGELVKTGPIPHHTVEGLTKWLVYDEDCELVEG